MCLIIKHICNFVVLVPFMWTGELALGPRCYYPLAFLWQ